MLENVMKQVITIFKSRTNDNNNKLMPVFHIMVSGSIIHLTPKLLVDINRKVCWWIEAKKLRYLDNIFMLVNQPNRKICQTILLSYDRYMYDTYQKFEMVAEVQKTFS